MALEIWGTFSVADHLSPQAFVADVLLYDRLVLPVPDAKERERWIRIGRQPDVLDRKLAILEEPSRRNHSRPSLVERVNWTEGFRSYLDREYDDERTAAREGMLRMEEGEALDRAMVAHWKRAGDPGTPEIVPAYTSYEAMEADWQPVPFPAQRVTRPDDRLVGVIGWEFFIPADPALNDDDLLAEAVRLTQSKQFRTKRSDFHRWRREVTRQGASPQQFRRELDSLLARYQEETAKVAVRTAVMNAFVILGASASLVAALAVPPAALAAPVLTLARVGVEKVWRTPYDPETRAVAMFRDARKHFRWTESS
jgi:hypothetical protein